MNREILFKAKRKDDGEWVEGYYLPGMKLPGYDGKNDFIVMSDGDYFAINPVTLCQYTGLTDKDGKKIWENDILRGYQYPYRSDGNDNYFAEVTWFENCPAFGIYTFKNPKIKCLWYIRRKYRIYGKLEF